MRFLGVLCHEFVDLIITQNHEALDLCVLNSYKLADLDMNRNNEFGKSIAFLPISMVA